MNKKLYKGFMIDNYLIEVFRLIGINAYQINVNGNFYCTVDNLRELEEDLEIIKKSIDKLK